MVRRLWNIQTIGKYLNWDSTKAVKSALLLLKESNLAILESVLNFWLVLLQNFRTCLSNFRFLSVEIPRDVLQHYFPRLNLSFQSFSQVFSELSSGIYLVVSSTKLHMSTSFIKKNKSFREMLKSKGPRTGPWGRPNIKSFQELKTFIFFLCFRFDK